MKAIGKIKNGRIKFDVDSCARQEVKGIFITYGEDGQDNGFGYSEYDTSPFNRNPQSEWCNEGGLTVK